MSLKWLLGALFGASLVAHAGARIQVQTPAVLAPDAPIADTVKAECGIESMVGEYTVKVLRESIVGIQPATEAQRSAADPYLKLTILWVYGGGWPGPKSVGLRADLLLGDRVVASEQFRQSSMAGLAGLVSGTCGNFDRIAKALGEELSEWLPEVTATQLIPKKPVVLPNPRMPRPQPPVHRSPVPPATDYAAIDDFKAVPLREQGKTRFQHYLTLLPPKAFVISENGSWVMVWNSPDAIDKSLDTCVQRGAPCWLYAVDDRVVWSAELGKRTGKPAAPDAAVPAVKRVSSAASQAVPSAEAQSPQPHRLPLPAATNFAAATDLHAVPLRAAGKERYKYYLDLPSPKAFVIYPDGGWRFASRNPDAMTELLDYCARQGKLCWLYAVDDLVVWSAEPDKRIGKSAQLGNP